MGKLQIINLSFGKPKAYLWNEKEQFSAIGKERVLEAFLSSDGLEGDGVANTEFHGGLDRALCVYPYEHYSLWEKEFQTKLKPPVFGENITTLGMTETDVCIGDIFKIEDAIVQVTQGRIPCSTISKHNRIEPLLKRVFDTCLTGYFMKVLEEGTIKADSRIVLLEKNPHGISVLSAAKCVLHNGKQKEEIIKILEVESLAEEWRKQLVNQLSRIKV